MCGLDQVQPAPGARTTLVPIVIAASAHERCIVVVTACGNDRRALCHAVMIAISDTVFLARNDEDATLSAVATGVCADIFGTADIARDRKEGLVGNGVSRNRMGILADRADWNGRIGGHRFGVDYAECLVPTCRC